MRHESQWAHESAPCCAHPDPASKRRIKEQPVGCGVDVRRDLGDLVGERVDFRDGEDRGTFVRFHEGCVTPAVFEPQIRREAGESGEG